MAVTLEIDGWTPPSVNRLLKAHWAESCRLKRLAVDELAVAVMRTAQPPPIATTRRRVDVLATYPGTGRLPDPDNLLKALLDALKRNRLLVDDSDRWCKIGDVAVARGASRRTTITLQDI